VPPTGAILDSAKSSLYKTPPSMIPKSGYRFSDKIMLKHAQVAQLVEHCTENAGVGGSIPPLGTTSYFEREVH
jgi:hypothetical protein